MKSTVVFMALAVFTVQSAVLRSEDAVLERVERSPCDSCEHHHYGPHPPPPPPFFQTQQWSGLSRSANGGQGVFSGAAASAAAAQAPEDSEQAFSIASSAAGSGGFDGQFTKGGGGTGKFAGASRGFKESHYSVQNYGGQRGIRDQKESGGEQQSGEFTSDAQGQTKGSFGNKDAGFGHGGHGGFTASEDHEKVKEDEHANSNHHGGYGGNQQEQSSGFGSSTQTQDKSSFGSGQNRVAGSGHGESALRGDQEQEQVGHSHLAHAGNNQHGGYGGSQQQQSSGFGSASEAQAESSFGQGGSGSSSQSGQLDSASHTSAQKQSNIEKHQQSGTSSQFDGQKGESIQSTLGGALNLASQGLQQQAGCSTCGKGGYALSNAKSYSGSAVAVSIGG